MSATAQPAAPADLTARADRDHQAPGRRGLSAAGPRPVLVTLVLLGLLVTGALLAWWHVTAIDRDLRAHLLLDTRLLAQALNVERMLALAGDATDLDDPNYQRLKHQFAAIANANDRWRFVYLIGRRPTGEFFLHLDSEAPDSPDYSPPGDPYPEASGAWQRLFARGEESVEGPLADRWGTWVSAQVPVFERGRGGVGGARRGDAEAMVARAVAYYQRHGREQLLAALGRRDGRFHHGDLYAFAYDLDMTFLAHPVRPELVGENWRDRPDRGGGDHFRKQIQHTALTTGQGWVDYEYENPATGRIEPKSTFVQRLDDLILCAGVYQNQGRVIAALGVDVHAEDWQRRVLDAALPAALLTAALCVIVLAGARLLRHHAGHHRDAARAHLLEPLLVSLVGVSVTLYATWGAQAHESASRDWSFSQLATSRSDAIVRTLHDLRDIELEGLASFLETSTAVTTAEFRRYTEYLTRNPAIRGWGFAPRVAAADLSAFEATVRATGATGFHVWQERADGEREPVTTRADYFPAMFVAPSSPVNLQARGFDLGSEPVRRAAIGVAIATGLPTTTAPVTFVRETGSPQGLRLFRPVRAGTEPGGPSGAGSAVQAAPAVSERDGDGAAADTSQGHGVAVAALQLDTLLRTGPPDQATILELDWLEADGTRLPLASTWEAREALPTGPSLVRPLPIFGAVLLLTVRAGPSFLRLHPMRAAWTTALIGLLLTAAGTLMTAVLVRRDAGLVGLVNARTAELRQFFDAGLDMLCIASTDGRFLRLNPEWERTLGYPLSELEGRRFLELVHPDDQAATQAAMARVNAQTPLLSFENRYRCRDGSYRWIEWRAVPVGQRIYAAARDVSERKAAAAQDARRRALERAAAAISVDLATARSAGLDAIFNDALATIGGLLPADRAYLFRFTADGTRMSNTHEWCAAGIPSMMACNQDHLLAATPWWQARMQRREPVQITDVAALGPEAAVERAEFMAEGIRSLLCLPMADNRGQVWGFLGFDMVHRRHAWADSDVGLLRLLVQVIGSTIGRLEAFARLRESEATLQRQNRWQELLMSISATYISLPLAQVDAAIGRSLGELASFIGADRAYLFDYVPGPAGNGDGGVAGEAVGAAADHTGDGDASTPRCAQTHEWCADGIAARGDAPLPFARIPDWFDAHRQGRTVHLPDLPALPATHPVRALLAPRGVRSVIAVPTLDGEHCRGFVGFECERTTRAWSDTEQRLLSVFAQMLASVRTRRETEDVLRSSRAQAEAASRMKSEFLANMSHEIRTPMNAVVGLSQLLLLTELNDHQRDQLNKIQEASRLLLRIINDILDYSKIEAGKLELDREVFAIDTILTQMATLFGATAEEQGLELVFQVDADVPHALVGDSLRLGQVLANLLGNAIKFTERGTVAARIRRLAGDDAQVRLLFEVADTGIGLAAPTLSRLFQPFSQGDNSTTRKYGGTGLGLVISRKLVECMGGKLAVDSRLGEGSRFWFELWLPVAPQTSATPARYHGIAGSRVLVVDDQPTARAVLRDLLTSVRCQVTEADSGTAAVAAVTAAEQAGAPFEYLLLDWQMPGELDGLATVARLHALQEAGTLAVSTAPVIIVSAYHRDDLPADPPAFDRFLGKPVTASALFDTMIEASGGVSSPRPAPAPTSPPSFTGSRVLLAEDIPVNQLVARGMLERVGIRVTLAHNGAEAVQLATEQPFDLILMDLQMPVMDGFEATRRIRAEQPTLPIIALSAAVMADDREAVRAVGMNDHLAKPIDSNALYRAMAQWLPARAGPTHEPATLAAVPALAPGAGQDSAHRRLLRLFAAQLARDAPPLLAALHAQDWHTVQRLTHGLAGAAAIVGAEPLAASANAVNAALRAPIKTTAPISAAMHEALRTALTDIQAELTALAPAAAITDIGAGTGIGVGIGADAAPADPAALPMLLAALRNSELVDDGLLHSAAALFEARLGHGASAALGAAIERFDHDAAANELLALANRADLTLA